MGLIPRMTLTGERFTSGSRVDYKWVNGSTTPLEITASVQPLKPKEMEALSEGRRSAGQAYRLYTDDSLRTTQNSEKADRLTIFGNEYEIFSEDEWKNNIINKFIKYVCELNIESFLR